MATTRVIRQTGKGSALLAVLWVIALLLPSGRLHGDTGDIGEEIAELTGPVRIELKNGRFHSGQPVSFRDDVLVLRTFLDGGEVNQGFPSEQLARLHFPGEEIVAEARERHAAGEIAAAIPYLEALWRQRAPFLSLVAAETLDLLALLPGAHLEAGDPYRAIGLARTLLLHTTAAPARNRLHETVLLGHYRLEFYRETEELAREWIDLQDDFPASALGWRILADLALREEDLAQVKWRALQPVALAGPEPVPHLETCYALAIHAFHLEEDGTPQAARLYREMMDRQLPWPEAPHLAATGEFYRSLAARAAEKKATTAEPDLDLRPPEDDLNLPIRQVRKLLQAD